MRDREAVDECDAEIVADHHELARRKSLSIRDIAKHPLIGIEPKDPYGRIMVGLFERAGVDYRIAVKARFGTTVCGLVRHDLGIAIIDGFTVAHASMPGIRVIPISEPTTFQTFVAYRRDATLTTAAEFFIRTLRQRMKELASPPRAAA